MLHLTIEAPIEDHIIVHVEHGRESQIWLSQQLIRKEVKEEADAFCPEALHTYSETSFGLAETLVQSEAPFGWNPCFLSKDPQQGNYYHGEEEVQT